jgi:hypothetical protein
MPENTIVTLADSNYFQMLDELINSINKHPESNNVSVSNTLQIVLLCMYEYEYECECECECESVSNLGTIQGQPPLSMGGGNRR